MIDVSRTKKVSINKEYKSIARVGRDTYYDAEYIEFDHSDLWKPKEMNKLEKIWDVIETLYYAVKRNVKKAYWECRYGFERMFKGYDSVDTFETFYKFIDRYTKILAEYRKTHIGYCGEMTNEEWEATIDDMIYHLYYMDEEHVIDELERDVPESWTASSKTVYEIMDKHKDAFFELFSKYFYHLWD